MDVRFQQLESLHWLWPVLGLAVVMIVAARRRRALLERFADPELLPRLAPAAGAGRRGARAVLVLAALVSLVAAMLDPRWGMREEEVRQKGIDIVVVLDVSRSMLAEDVSPSRLARARQAVLDLVGTLRGDRVGLVAFAGVPSLACPLTVDYGALRLSLRDQDPELAPRGGSLLGDALRLAGEAFTDDLPDHKAVVVLSDGEDHGSYPVDAAAQLHERGIRVFTVGFGDAETGARIPVDGGWLTHQGETVWSRMDEQTLLEVAVAGGGAFVPAGTRRVELDRIYAERIAPITVREFETTRITRYNVQYQWFAACALVLLVIETFLPMSRTASPPRPAKETAT